ncbi:MAG TPA: glycogen synthase GlgA [Candidatus Marinimicrobia bacterium]|nr:glycogen synthase GlgA [Candidatus Neomarinimicrobiota bacterium]
MNIIFIAAEASPFAKVGGLGDVIGALPPVLANRGLSVKVIIPGSRSTWNFKTEPLTQLSNLTVTLGNRVVESQVRRWQNPAQAQHEVYFIDNPEYFGQRDVYCDENGKPYSDNPERFILFQKAALKLIAETRWSPDIIHCHDYHTALIPVYLKKNLAQVPPFNTLKSVLTLHNIAYQGDCEMQLKEICDLPEELFMPMGALEWYNRLNPLKGGIIFADAVTTVSPTHAREIMTDEELGAGMGGVLANRPTPVLGILNGIDTAEWNPVTDVYLFMPYSISNLAGKKVNKVKLIEILGLNPALESRPLLGIVSRLVEQKGIALLIDGLEKILSLGAGFVILGSGEQNYQRELKRLANQFSDRMAVKFDYDNVLAHRIIAGSDLFLMPSRFEPCGITQMYALNYGAVPVVHHTGGLADTVIPWDGKDGNGFAFREYRAEAMLKTVCEALQVFEKPDEWRKIIINGMSADFSWDRAATKYIALYENLINNKI